MENSWRRKKGQTGKQRNRTARRGLWRNRIVGYGDEPPGQLVPDPKNWRTHPKAQEEALRALLRKIGPIQNIVVNECRRLVDGHLRVALAITRGEKVPVSYVDLTPQEEDLILATFDRITGMATPDEEKLAELTAKVETDFPWLADMLESLNAGMEIEAEQEPAAGLTDDDATPEPPETPVTVVGDLWLLGAYVLLGQSGQAGVRGGQDSRRNGHAPDHGRVFSSMAVGCGAAANRPSAPSSPPKSRVSERKGFSRNSGLRLAGEHAVDLIPRRRDGVLRLAAIPLGRLGGALRSRVDEPLRGLIDSPDRVLQHDPFVVAQHKASKKRGRVQAMW